MPPRLVTANCPRCGAALELRPGLDVVTCHYCGFRSMIEWEGARAPRPPMPVAPLDPELGRIVARAPEAAAKALVWVIVASSLLPLVLGIVLWAITAAGARSASRAVTIAAGPGAGSPVPTVTPAPPLGPRRVDAAELVKKARALALAETPDPVFSSAVFFNVTGGLVDTNDSNAGSIDFDFRTTDPNAPPGKDTSDAKLIVHVSKGNLTTTRMPWGAPDRSRALDVPSCSSQSAWAAAVKSGVPENAVATLHLYDNRAFSPKSPTVWSVRVDGHDEYRREIDAKTCAMVKSWGAPATPGKRR
jgi:hypothetical protein